MEEALAAILSEPPEHFCLHTAAMKYSVNVSPAAVVFTALPRRYPGRLFLPVIINSSSLPSVTQNGIRNFSAMAYRIRSSYPLYPVICSPSILIQQKQIYFYLITGVQFIIKWRWIHDNSFFLICSINNKIIQHIDFLQNSEKQIIPLTQNLQALAQILVCI